MRGARTITFAEAAREMRERVDRFPQAVAKGKAEVCAEAVPAIQEDWPIDTRFSSDSWGEDGTGVFCTAEYASYVHDGLADRLVPQVIDELAPLFTEVLERELGAEPE